MKKGISDIMFTPQWEAEIFFKEANRSGFSGTEINFCEEEGILTKSTSLIEANKLAHMAANYQLEITSISSDLFKHYAFTSSDVRLRKSGEEIGRRMIEFAVEMGINVINILPGIINKDISYEKGYEKAVESIKRLGDEAATAGVIIGVENTANNFLPSPKEFISFLDDLNHSTVKAYFNTANALVTGYPKHFIDSLSDRIIGVHVKDYSELNSGFKPILEGDIDWPTVMNALHQSYDGYLISVPPQAHKHVLERHMDRYSRDVSALLSLLDPIDTI